MTDILFLLMALALVALVMVPVVAEGIHHTRFWARRALTDSLARLTDGALKLARALDSLGEAAALMRPHIELFERAIIEAGRRYR